MNKMITLIRREYWENRGVFFKLPALIGGFIILIVMCYVILLATHVTHYTSDVDVHELMRVATTYTFYGMSLPFIIIVYPVAFYYFLSCLYDERKDRSILFWQSMPIANWETILSKAIAGLLMTPICAWLCIIITEFIYLIFASIAAKFIGLTGINAMWSPLTLALTWLHILAILFYQMVWLFPLLSWCMLCSAYAKKSPFLTAVVPIIFLLIMELFFFHSGALGSYVISRFHLGFLAWNNLFLSGNHLPLLINKSLSAATLTYYNNSLYWGFAAGIIFMLAAIYLRYRGRHCK